MVDEFVLSLFPFRIAIRVADILETHEFVEVDEVFLGCGDGFTCSVFEEAYSFSSGDELGVGFLGSAVVDFHFAMEDVKLGGFVFGAADGEVGAEIDEFGLGSIDGEAAGLGGGRRR